MFILMMLLTSHSEFYQYHFTGIFFLSEIQPKICVTYDNVLTVVEFHIVACMYHTMKFQNCHHTNVFSLTDPLGGRQPYRQSPKGPTMNFFGLNERSW